MKHTHTLTHTHFQLLWRISEAPTAVPGPCSPHGCGGQAAAVLLERLLCPARKSPPGLTVSLDGFCFCRLVPAAMEFVTALPPPNPEAND